MSKRMRLALTRVQSMPKQIFIPKGEQEAVEQAARRCHKYFQVASSNASNAMTLLDLSFSFPSAGPSTSDQLGRSLIKLGADFTRDGTSYTRASYRILVQSFWLSFCPGGITWANF